MLFSKHFNLQSGGRLAGVKREIKTETTGSIAYNFSVLKKVSEEPNFSVNRTALLDNFDNFDSDNPFQEKCLNFDHIVQTCYIDNGACPKTLAYLKAFSCTYFS